MYRFFVSYNYTSNNGFGFGRTIVTTDHDLLNFWHNGTTVLEAIEKELSKDKPGIIQLTILNIVESR